MFRERRLTLPIVCGLLVLAVIAVYGQTAGHDFVNFDDGPYVYENRHVLQGLSESGIVWAFTRTDVSAQWQPLTLLSLMADAELMKRGNDPPDRTRLAAEMHVVNVALHALNAVILFLVLRAMTSLPSPSAVLSGGRGTMLRTVPGGVGLWPSALVAALFAVHPVHVESVAWITERKDVLSGLFGLLTLAAYVWYVRRPGLARYLWVAAALALGLMAKPMLVTWPLVLLLLDYWPLGRWQGAGSREQGGKGEREQGRKGERGKGRKGAGEKGSISLSPFPPCSLSFLIVEKIPLLLLAAASATVAFLAQRTGGAIISLETVPIFTRIGRAAVLYAAYLGKTFWPANLTAAHVGGPTTENTWPAMAAAGLLLTLLTAGAVWGAWRGQRWLAVGWFWFLGTLVPTIGLVQVGLQVIADRFLYLPQIGLCIAVAWGVGRKGEREKGSGGEREKGGKGEREPGGFSLSPSTRCAGAPPFSLSLLSALLLAALTTAAWQQTRHWRDSESLWARALALNPRNPAALNNLGEALMAHGHVDEAIAHYRMSLAIDPDHEAAHNNLGVALAGRGLLDEAIEHYQKALNLKPDHAETYDNLGLALVRRGQVDQAVACFRQALKLKPELAAAHNDLGLALAGLGQLDAAIAEYEMALELEPGDAPALTILGNALASRGRTDEAIVQYRKALQRTPDYAEAHNNLGLALARRGEIDEALLHFQQAVASRPDFADAHNNLGAALSGRGRLDEAILHFRKALELEPENVDARANLAGALARKKQLQHKHSTEKGL